MFWVIASTVVTVLMATTMIFVRAKAAKKPASVKKIVLPPFMMSTGALMYIYPAFRLTVPEIFEALVVGIIFSSLLIITSKFEVKGKDIYVIPSKIFILVLVGLLVVRMILKTIIGQTISVGETSGMFFLLAFGMIFTWRMVMLYKFLKLKKTLENDTNSTLKTQTTL